MFGCCITFFIIIGDQLDQSTGYIFLNNKYKSFSHILVFSCIHGPNFDQFWYFNRKFTITISSLLLILPLCYAKRIDFLTYPRYSLNNALKLIHQINVFFKHVCRHCNCLYCFINSN